MPGWISCETKAWARPAHGLGLGALVIGLLALIAPASRADGLDGGDRPSGEVIYRQMCADCHGLNGVDLVDAHGEPLEGDRTLDELVKIVNDTMPDGFPEDCQGEDAERVAAYLYDTVYSPEAKARNKPPRIALSRLTVRQYENSVADLLASFTGQGWPDDQRGLSAQYYKSRNFQRKEKAFDRVDPHVDFEYGEGTPDKEKIEKAEEFSARWEGSLIAPETGEYEFVLATENGSRLWVNDPETPLIDAWVASGGEVMEHHATRRLLAGRRVPDPARLLQVQGQDRVDRAALASRRTAPRKSCPNAVLTAEVGAGDDGRHHPVPARRRQRRLRTGHVGLQSLGRGDDLRGRRGRQLPSPTGSTGWRERGPAPRTASQRSATSAPGSPNGPSAAR